jgi:methyl-accepting chemotaxis protein
MIGTTRINAACHRRENPLVNYSVPWEVAMIRHACLLAFLASVVLTPVLTAQATVVEETFALDAAVTLDAYSTAADSRIEGVLAATRTLAATEEAKSGDWARMREPLAVLAANLTERAAVWYARPDGSYFTVEKGLTGETLRERAYFPGLMAGHDVVGALVVSKSTGKRSLIVASPVLLAGKVVGAVGVSLDAAKFAASLDQAICFPPDVVFYALDHQGRTALHRAGDLIFVFPSDVGSPTLGDAVRTMLSKPQGVVHYTYAGSDRTAVFRRSTLTGWVFVLGKSHPPAVTP